MDGLIYAYQLPKSVAQQKYMQERRAALIEARKRNLAAAAAAGGNTDTGAASTSASASTATTAAAAGSGVAGQAGDGRSAFLQPHQNEQYLQRTLSGADLSWAVDKIGSHTHRRNNSNSHSHSGHGEMEYPRTSSSTSSSQSEAAHHNLLSNPFELRHGRRYLRELPYPLPVDLHEIQRQNLRTLLCCRVFGKAVCSPAVEKCVPKRVLEIGCGSGYWSTMCHEYFSSLGHSKVAFTGLDVAPLAPDLRRSGIDWTFVQHDCRRIPFPFDDDQFDLVMLKDMSLVLPLGMASERFIEESIRVLAPNGTLEVWESDHVLRSLTSRPPIATKQAAEQKAAAHSATFLVSPGTPFAPAQNKYLQQANVWIQEALDKRKLPPMPCSRIANILLQEADSLTAFGARRVAVPLGELRWERDGGGKHSRNLSAAHDSVLMPSKGKGKAVDRTPGDLTPDQAALRQVALLTVVQMIENLEPLLKDASGKNTEEWSHWWATMMGNLMEASRTNLTGECLEIGAWWATKLEDS